MTELRRMYGLTAQAIRLYEARGLVAATRDRRNARCFTRPMANRLGLIKALREGGLGLAEIESILAAPAGSEARRALLERLLSARLAHLKAQTRAVERAMADFVVRPRAAN